MVKVGTSVTYNSNNQNIYGDVLEKTKQLPGIYDNVELILTGTVYVEKVQVIPQLEKESVRVVASARMQNMRVPVKPRGGKKAEPVHSNDLGYPVFMREKMSPGQQISGPAIILDPYSTTFLEKGWKCEVIGMGTLE